MDKRYPWLLTTRQIIVMLTLANAERARRGQASPVAARVLARLEG